MHAGSPPGFGRSLALRLLPRRAAREVTLFVLLLAGLGLAVVTAEGVSAWRTVTTTEYVAEVNDAAETLLRAVDGIQAERGRMQNALLAADPADAATLAAIATPRAASEAAAADGLRRLPPHATPGMPGRVAAAQAALASLRQLRAEADAALRLPRAQRNEAVVAGWYDRATATAMALNAVWVEASATASAADPVLARLNETIFLAQQMREDAGVERAAISAFVSGAVAATPDRVAAWAARRGAVALAWRRLVELNPEAGTAPGILAAIRNARETYHGRFAETRDAVVAAALAGAASPVPLSEWQPFGDRALATLVAIRDAAVAEGRRHEQAAVAEARFVLARDVLLAGLALAIAALALMRLAQRLLRPLASVLSALGEIARGNTRPSLPRPWRADDEIGVLVGAVRNLAEQTEERGRMEAERAAAAEEQAARMRRLDALIAGFEADAARALATVDRAAQGLDTTAAGMADAAAAGVRLTSAVALAAGGAASNTQVAAAAAEELTASVGEISRQVTQAADVARRAAEETGRTDATMQDLTAAAERIGVVVDLISGIAQQTNLLALNATIEAARAGEAGKGFAVVASEVKTLAGQTAKATQDIVEQIASIRGAAEAAVGTVRGIGTVIGEIDRAAASIAAAVEQQGAATAEIARGITAVAGATQDVSRDTRAASEAASRTGEAAEEVRASSRDVTREASDLRGRIGGFLAEVRAA